MVTARDSRDGAAFSMGLAARFPRFLNSERHDISVDPIKLKRLTSVCFGGDRRWILISCERDLRVPIKSVSAAMPADPGGSIYGLILCLIRNTYCFDCFESFSRRTSPIFRHYSLMISVRLGISGTEIAYDPVPEHLSSP